MNTINISDDAISTIATSILTSLAEASNGRTNYLRTLVAAAQEALGRKRGQTPQAQLEALKATHTHFYELVMQAAETVVPKSTKNRPVELHRRANFARTALSAVRGHVRAGEDLCAVNAAKVTKGSLAVRDSPLRPSSPRRWHQKAVTRSKALMAAIMGLADADKGAAVEEIKSVMDQLSAQLLHLVGEPAAPRRGRPPKTVFVPTETQVIRQRANPS